MVLIDNLVSYYKCEDNAANTTVVDSHGINTGTASTNTSNLSVAGKIDNAFDFNGSNESVGLGASPTFASDSVGSMSVWIYPHTIGNFMIMTESDSTTSAFFLMSTDGNGDLKVGTNSASVFKSGNPVVANTWVHIVFTSDGSTWKIYKDGVEQTSLTGTNNGDWWDFHAEDINIGILDRSGTNLYADGLIDELGIWERELSQAEVTELYNNGNGLAYPFTAPPPPPTIADPVGRGQKEIRTNWPIEEGIILGTTKIEGRQINLVPEVSNIRQEFQKGL